MRRIVHLSDLHFGRLDTATLAPLRDAVRCLRPHLVVISGDLTQRARPAQFRAARDYLETLDAPFLATPGNHDVPLWNLAARLFQPLRRYRRHFHADPEPVFVDDELAVATISTPRRLVVKGGRINTEQLDRVGERLAGLGDGALKLVVTHHPIAPGAMHSPHDLVGRARRVVESLRLLGADLLLAGHLHRAGAGVVALATGRSAIGVQAGTATSSRTRAEANGFNVLDLSSCRAAVERFAFDGTRFAGRGAPEVFARGDGGWARG